MTEPSSPLRGVNTDHAVGLKGIGVSTIVIAAYVVVSAPGRSSVAGIEPIVIAGVEAEDELPGCATPLMLTAESVESPLG